MRKDPKEFRERFLRWKAGELVYKDGLPAYRGGKLVLNNYTNAEFNDDGTFTDDTTRLFDDFYVTPSGVKTKYGSYTDKNWDRYKQQERFFKTHDLQTGKLKYESGLEIVSPEYDILTLGAGARTNALTQTFLKSRKVANAIRNGIKENAIITGYNRNHATKELGTIWDYQSYLDNAFPNSKIKDVLWHGSTKKNLLSFSTEYIGSSAPIKKSVGMYLAPEKTTAANYGRKGDIYPVLLNTENPFITNQFFGGISKNGINITRISPKTRNTILANNDAVIAPTRGEIAFFEPNDALILGSDRDVEGFRKFMFNHPTTNPKVRTRVGDVEINNPQLAYRQGGNDIVEDFINSGKVRTKESQDIVDTGKGFTFDFGHTYSEPMFAQGRLNWGLPTGNNAQNTGLLTTSELLGVGNRQSRLVDNVVNGTTDIRIFPTRGRGVTGRVPLSEDQLNATNTTAYIWDPGYGYRKVISMPTTFTYNMYK